VPPHCVTRKRFTTGGSIFQGVTYESGVARLDVIIEINIFRVIILSTSLISPYTDHYFSGTETIEVIDGISGLTNDN
jgi:hypothetical protein